MSVIERKQRSGAALNALYDDVRCPHITDDDLVAYIEARHAAGIVEPSFFVGGQRVAGLTHLFAGLGYHVTHGPWFFGGGNRVSVRKGRT